MLMTGYMTLMQRYNGGATIMYTNAKYIVEVQGEEPSSISILIDGRQSFVPAVPANSHYAEIMRLVEAGELTIAPADSEGS